MLPAGILETLSLWQSKHITLWCDPCLGRRNDSTVSRDPSTVESLLGSLRLVGVSWVFVVAVAFGLVEVCCLWR